MRPRAPFVVGLLLVAVGVSLPLFAWRNQISDRGLTPFDVMADLSGATIKAEFTAQRTDSYEAFVALKLPPGVSPDMYGCLLRNPDAKPDSICHTPGRLAVTWALTDIDGKPQTIGQVYATTSYEVVGGNQVTAKRELGFFDTTAGRQYAVTARIKSDDPTIGRLKPRLTAFVSDPGIGESIALSQFMLCAAFVIGAILLLIGLSIAVVTRPRKQAP
jgi:hypothetical protein